uniref:Uncharacterized protein n=1 Tax=Geospiza parvula TaxID=87175 RepID=A0A8C3MPJ0_GEOPR
TKVIMVLGEGRWRRSHRATAKSGVCPVVLRGSLGPCLELCDTDSDCTGDDKCCTTGCGHICKPPTKEHPGQCPRAGPCWELRRGRQCLDDSVCGRGEKCCDTGCGRMSLGSQVLQQRLWSRLHAGVWW